MCSLPIHGTMLDINGEPLIFTFARGPIEVLVGLSAGASTLIQVRIVGTGHLIARLLIGTAELDELVFADKAGISGRSVPFVILCEISTCKQELARAYEGLRLTFPVNLKA